MNWTEKYQPNRDQYWPDVESFFSALPPPLFRQGVLLKNNLALTYSDTGQFADILCRPADLPLLYLHFWLLDDWSPGDPTGRTSLEKHLFLAMLLTFAAVHTGEQLADESSTVGKAYLFLARTLMQAAQVHLAHIQPGSSPFWDHFQKIWQEQAAAHLLPPSSTPTPTPIAGRLAFMKIPVAATALWSGQEARLPRLFEMVDRLAFAHQTRLDLASLRRDLRARRYSLSLLRAMAAAGLDSHQPARPETMLGTLILTGAIKKLRQEALDQLAAGRTTAQTLQLPTFTAYFSFAADLIRQALARFDLKAKPEQPPEARDVKESRPLFKPAIDPLDQALKMAEGYLLSDLSFRESWAVQRGLLNLPELTARAFPTGLVVERLCQQGHPLTEQIDQIYRILQASRFRYYEENLPLPPDADDLGLLLRLYRYGVPDRRAAYRTVLQEPLGWLENSILPSGEIPVWFRTDEENSPRKDPPLLIWGNRCATTESHLLLGLIDYDWSGYRSIIEKSALKILDRFGRWGLTAALYYVPSYILANAFELILRLSSLPIQASLHQKMKQTLPMLLEQLELETKRDPFTPQTAALLSLTCCQAQTRSFFQAGWISLLLKSQRYDGSWEAEPIFLIPGRGGTAWYSSRSVTTAICYQALKTVSSQPEAD